MKKGLTLVEVMVAVTIFSLLSVSLSLLFRSGISVRKRIEAEQGTLTHIYLNLEKMAKELRNAVSFRRDDTGLYAVEKEIEFYTVVFDYRENVPKILKINYHFKDKQLIRTAREPFQEEEEEPLTRFAVFENLEELSFSYFDEDKQAWQEEWDDQGNFPVGIKMELAYRDARGEISLINKYVFIHR